jgi:hypothetical protein
MYQCLLIVAEQQRAPARTDMDCFLCGQGSDRFYAMTQCTHVNNGGGDVFCMVVAVVI